MNKKLVLYFVEIWTNSVFRISLKLIYIFVYLILNLFGYKTTIILKGEEYA